MPSLRGSTNLPTALDTRLNSNLKLLDVSTVAVTISIGIEN